MARYILLRVADDEEADELLLDLVQHPERSITTSYLHAPVHAELVQEVDPSDSPIDCQPATVEYSGRDQQLAYLRDYLRSTYRHAMNLLSTSE